MKLGDLEYVDGQLVITSNVSNAFVSNIYDKKQMGVMSNEPIFNEQLKLNCFWEYVDEKVFLPGSNQPVDRFVRASYYSKNLQTNIVTDNEALAGVLSVMCNAAGPIGKSALDGKKNPNINPTRWTTLSDQEKQVYYFSAAQGPFIIYLSLNDKDIKCRLASLYKGLALKLSLNKNNGTLMHQGKDVAGSAEMYLEDCVPFDFLPAN